MEIKEHGITAEQLATFANSLRIGNVVKFARFIPPAYENENCLLNTKEMITAINHLLNKKEKIDP